MTGKGKFIVLEGLDGSGKTVQFQLLQQKLAALDIPFTTADFPTYNTFYGKMVGSYLNKEYGDVYEVSPYLSSLLYAENRKESAPILWKALEDGYIILANRYVGANLAYHSVKLPPEQRPAFIEWVKELEYNQLVPIPRENLVIYFNSEVNVAQRMVDQKGVRGYTDYQRDIHERNADYLSEVAKTYLYLCQTEPNWLKLDVIDPTTSQMFPPEVIHEQVMTILRQHQIL